MSISRKLATNSIIQIGGKAISTFLGMIALFWLARILGPEQFGWYGTALAFLGFAGIVIDFGIIPTTAQLLSEPDAKEQHILENIFGLRLISAIIFFATVPAIAWLFPYPRPVHIAITVLSIAFFCNALNQVCVGYHQQTLRMHVQVIGEVLSRIALLGGIIALAQGSATFLPLMFVVAGSSALQCVVPLIDLIRKTNLRPRIDLDVWKKILHTMWPIAVAIMCNVVYLKGDVLILAQTQSQVDVGLYNAAYRVLDILAQLAMMLMGLLLPLMAHAWSRQDRKTFSLWFQQSFDLMLLCAVPATVGLILVAPEVMVLFGEEFLPAAPILQILSLAVFGLFLGAVFGHAAVATGTQKKTLWIYAINAIITVTGYLIFIPKFSMYGAAWMTVCSELITGIGLAIAIRWYTKSTLSYRNMFKILLATSVMSFIVLISPRSHLAIVIPLAAATYITMLFATKMITPAYLKSLKTNTAN
jgi:O-antigen/teichoic acid export membrane protein